MVQLPLHYTYMYNIHQYYADLLTTTLSFKYTTAGRRHFIGELNPLVNKQRFSSNGSNESKAKAASGDLLLTLLR